MLVIADDNGTTSILDKNDIISLRSCHLGLFRWLIAIIWLRSLDSFRCYLRFGLAIYAAVLFRVAIRFIWWCLLRLLGDFRLFFNRRLESRSLLVEWPEIALAILI